MTHTVVEPFVYQQKARKRGQAIRPEVKDIGLLVSQKRIKPRVVRSKSQPTPSTDTDKEI
jgi:hypothetical protein